MKKLLLLICLTLVFSCTQEQKVIREAYNFEKDYQKKIQNASTVYLKGFFVGYVDGWRATSSFGSDPTFLPGIYPIAKDNNSYSEGYGKGYAAAEKTVKRDAE